MDSYDAASLIGSAISSFTARQDSVHEQISRIDFVIRLTLALSAPGALSRTDLQIRCNPGLGSLQEMLELVKEHAHEPFSEIADAGLRLLATPLPAAESELQAIYRLRNYLFHGGALPDDAVCRDLSQALASAVDTAAEEVAAALAGASIDLAPSRRSGPSVVTLNVGGQPYELFPLLALNSVSNSVLVFSRVTSGAVILTAPKHEPKQVIPRSRCEDKLRRLFKIQTPSDSRMSDLTQAALDDLEGFRELGSSIVDVAEAEGVYIRWEHADGSEAVSRQDRLRVGPDNAWQWFDGGEWKGYSELLRQLANWPRLTKRLAHMLDKRATDAKDNENVLLPLPPGIRPPFVPPIVQVAPINVAKEEYSLEKFTERLDADVQANRGTTYLYFIHAEAGPGRPPPC